MLTKLPLKSELLVQKLKVETFILIINNSYSYLIYSTYFIPNINFQVKQVYICQPVDYCEQISIVTHVIGYKINFSHKILRVFMQESEITLNYVMVDSCFWIQCYSVWYNLAQCFVVYFLLFWIWLKLRINLHD